MFPGKVFRRRQIIKVNGSRNNQQFNGLIDSSKPIIFLLIVCGSISAHKKCRTSSKIHLGGVTLKTDDHYMTYAERRLLKI